MAKFHVFVDANVLLSLYRYSNDDLEKLTILIEGFTESEIQPYINNHLKDEVARNRAKVLDGLITELRKQKVSVAVPNACRDHPAAQELFRLCRVGTSKLKELIEEFTKMACDGSLPADDVIAKYFNAATVHDVDDALVAKARTRVELRNPPLSKSGSIGDALHWEFLLRECPHDSALHLISQDSGFSSPLNPTRIDEFLADEWARRSLDTVNLYPSISDFLSANLPSITLPGDLRRNKLITALRDSANFAETHRRVADLQAEEIENPRDAERILQAAIDNTQICLIITDEDVWAYFGEIYRKFQDRLDPELKEQYNDLLSEQVDPSDEAIQAYLENDSEGVEN